MGKIKDIFAREILDSRGTPTVEVDLILEDGSFGRGDVPSGTSSGKHEANEKRDGGERYSGKGVAKTVNLVNTELKANLLGKDFDQASLDRAMIDLDGTTNKSRLGANGILGISIAFLRASALSRGVALYRFIQKLNNLDRVELPKPMILILEGGKHADNSSDFQEFMIIPHGAASIKEAIEWGARIYRIVGENLRKQGFNTNVGYEGAYGPELKSNEKVFEELTRGIQEAGFTPGEEVSIAVDAAASEFYDKNSKKYLLKSESKELTSDELITFYDELSRKYPISSLEDPLAEDDWEGYVSITKKLSGKMQIVGDDLFVTNKQRLQKGVDMQAGNAILIKPNQIGTISETFEAVQLAKESGYRTIISHRSGDTEDPFIADLSVGLDAKQIKTGAISRSERLAKYNQLIRIEEELKYPR